jgi:hypothetical protein
MKSLRVVLLLLASILAGCAGGRVPVTTTGNVSAQTIDDIASCDSGISALMSISLKLEIDKIMQSGGGFSTGLIESMAGTYAAKMPPNDARLAAEDFRKCMDSRRTERRSEIVNQCKSSWQCDMNKMAGVCNCRKVVEEEAQKQKWNEQKQAQMYKEMCAPGIASVSACWPANRIDQERARCEVVLQKESLMPKFDSSSCSVS